MGIAVFFAGCSGSTPAPQEVASAPVGTVSADDDATAAEVGAIEGVVTDDELAPIPNATVALAKLAISVRTDPGGAFLFENVAPGSHVVLAQALGFDQGAKKVDVVAGETARVNFELEPVAIGEPYINLRKQTTIITGYYLEHGVLDIVCNCSNSFTQWTQKVTKGVGQLVIEVDGRHSVPNALMDDALITYISTNTGKSLDTCHEITIGSPPENRCTLPVIWRHNDTELLGDVAGIDYWYICEAEWFCLDDRYETYTSLFYNFLESDVPPDYSARPKG